ncbi:MAG: Clp protease N-terminal domain-containing protein [Solirubrobacteraceae bacterium]
MFEQFTDRARFVVAEAQEEARELRHSHVGSEHLLLGLLREEDGAAARALVSLDVTLDRGRGAGRAAGRPRRGTANPWERDRQPWERDRQPPVRLRSRRARSGCWNAPSARRSSWVTTTSGRSTSCSLSRVSARAKA